MDTDTNAPLFQLNGWQILPSKPTEIKGECFLVHTNCKKRTAIKLYAMMSVGITISIALGMVISIPIGIGIGGACIAITQFELEVSSSPIKDKCYRCEQIVPDEIQAIEVLYNWGEK